MHIHYVEDSKLDARAMRHVLAGESDILLDISEKLDDVGSVEPALPIDVLLIDVVRPDAISLETDVSSARRFTQAPILFLTGLDPAQVRQRAMAAGADAVLRKGNISGDMLRQFAENAHARARIRDQQREHDELEEAEFAILPLMAIDGPLASVEQGLTRLAQRSGAASRLSDVDAIQQHIDTLRHVRRLGARDLRQRSDCDAATMVQAIAVRAHAQAQNAGVRLSFGYEDNAWFTALGSRLDALAGLEALILGFIGHCRRLDRLHIQVRKHGDSAAIEIASNRALFENREALFGDASNPLNVGISSASAHLQCAMALLMLRAEQIRIVSDHGQLIEIDL